MGEFTSEQIELIRQQAIADADADYQRLTGAGYTHEQTLRMMSEMVHERALQNWNAHGQEVLQLGQETVPEAPIQEEKKPRWKFW